MVLLPKGKWDYRGIRLVEVMGNVCAVVVNSGVEIHDTLHVFRKGRGKGTATLEAKLAQHMAGLSQVW